MYQRVYKFSIDLITRKFYSIDSPLKISFPSQA